MGWNLMEEKAIIEGENNPFRYLQSASEYSHFRLSFLVFDFQRVSGLVDPYLLVQGYIVFSNGF